MNSEAKIKFLEKVEKWRMDNFVSQREMMIHLGLRSSATYALWIKPRTGDPQISEVNIKRLEKITGIRYEEDITC